MSQTFVKFDSYIGEDTGIQVLAWVSSGDDVEAEVFLAEPGEAPKTDDLWDSLSEDVQDRIRVKAIEVCTAALADKADEMEAREEDYYDKIREAFNRGGRL